ncbi:MAG: hypothetical protein M3X11_15945 [Acidobacteriota bacterium]|nr:hypothetical protein [Acidobacteriota bacterium]
MKSLRTLSYRTFGLLVWALALALIVQPIAPLTVTRGAGRMKTSEKPATNSTPNTVTRARVEENYGKLPLSFEANKGQTDARVKFLSRGQGYSFFLTPNEAVMTLNRAEAKEQGARTKKETSAPLRMKLVGANEQPRISGLDEQAGKSNYFLGNDARQWKTDVPNYSKVKYEGVYPGVDLVYYGNQQQLEYDFIIAPGADPKQCFFVAELSAAGNQLLSYSPFDLGEYSPSIPRSIVVDAAGSIYVTENAYITLLTTPWAYRTTFTGQAPYRTSPFVLKLVTPRPVLNVSAASYRRFISTTLRFRVAAESTTRKS